MKTGDPSPKENKEEYIPLPKNLDGAPDGIGKEYNYKDARTDPDVDTR
ncbi:MAG: hypothetical protein GY777_04285 [Candidatus Brocadiaceae bacterium]|nr:hypothetical protein [Candidatus Brocadiaceae bacterium]